MLLLHCLKLPACVDYRRPSWHCPMHAQDVCSHAEVYARMCMHVYDPRHQHHITEGILFCSCSPLPVCLTGLQGPWRCCVRVSCSTHPSCDTAGAAGTSAGRQSCSGVSARSATAAPTPNSSSSTAGPLHRVQGQVPASQSTRQRQQGGSHPYRQAPPAAAAAAAGDGRRSPTGPPPCTRGLRV